MTSVLCVVVAEKNSRSETFGVNENTKSPVCVNTAKTECLENNMTKWDKQIQMLEREVRQLKRENLQLKKENESLKRRERSLMQDKESLEQAIDKSL